VHRHDFDAVARRGEGVLEPPEPGERETESAVGPLVVRGLGDPSLDPCPRGVEVDPGCGRVAGEAMDVRGEQRPGAVDELALDDSRSSTEKLECVGIVPIDDLQPEPDVRDSPVSRGTDRGWCLTQDLTRALYRGP
jgi:hypothetical protein